MAIRLLKAIERYQKIQEIDKSNIFNLMAIFQAEMELLQKILGVPDYWLRTQKNPSLSLSAPRPTAAIRPLCCVGMDIYETQSIKIELTSPDLALYRDQMMIYCFQDANVIDIANWLWGQNQTLYLELPKEKPLDKGVFDLSWNLFYERKALFDESKRVHYLTHYKGWHVLRKFIQEEQNAIKQVLRNEIGYLLPKEDHDDAISVRYHGKVKIDIHLPDYWPFTRPNMKPHYTIDVECGNHQWRGRKHGLRKPEEIGLLAAKQAQRLTNITATALFEEAPI